MDIPPSAASASDAGRLHGMEVTVTDETKAELERALAAHFAAEQDGALLGDWIVAMAGVHLDDTREFARYSRDCAEGQPLHVSLGLYDYGRTMTHHRMADDD